jgi:hypothetical protein
MVHGYSSTSALQKAQSSPLLLAGPTSDSFPVTGNRADDTEPAQRFSSRRSNCQVAKKVMTAPGSNRMTLETESARVETNLAASMRARLKRADLQDSSSLSASNASDPSDEDGESRHHSRATSPGSDSTNPQLRQTSPKFR